MSPKRKPEQNGKSPSPSEEASSHAKKQKSGETPSHSLPIVTKSLSPTSVSSPIPLNPTLTDLFGGCISENEFLSDVFRKKAMHVDCADLPHIRKMRLQQLVQEMFNLQPEKILSETSSDSVFVWLRGKSDGKAHENIRNTLNGLIQSIEVGDVHTAIALHKVGHATYCRAPPSVEQNLVAGLLRATGMGNGHYDPSGESNLSLGRGEVETFLSTPGHVTDWHFDFQENFTIQLSGTKKWTLMEGTIADPLRGCTPHYNSPESVESQLKAGYLYDKKFVFGKPQAGVNAKGAEQSILIKPGDVLYFPAGMWHKVEAVEPGVSINVSLMATNYAQAVSQAVYHYLYSDARFRQPIINNSVTNAPDHLQNLMKDLPGIIQQLSKPNGEGAFDIMPPALQFAPNFTIEEEEDDMSDSDGSMPAEDGEGMADGNESGDSNGPPDNGDADEEAANAERRQDVAEDDSLIDDLDTLEPDTVTEYPSDWKFTLEMGSKIQLFKNPLSALHKLEEITQFYNGTTPNKKRESNKPGVFVLNVNYGGNEAHESAIRTQFRDNEEGMVQRLWELEREGTNVDFGAVPIDELMVSEDNHFWISFLVFHGYMQVKTVKP